MMKIIKTLLFVLIVSGLTAQVNEPSEKLYVHMDKPAYMAGEIMWYKVYNVAPLFNNEPLSKVAYIEVFNESDSAVYQATVNLDDACGGGSFHLPFSLTTGNYQLIAYTKKMRFAGSAYFKQLFQVINITSSTPGNLQLNENTTESYDVQIFPEGGNFVNGLQSRTGIKVVNNKGQGVNFTGKLLTATGNEVLNFASYKNGMGAFSHMPARGAKYIARVVMPGGKQVEVSLPEALESGAVITVNVNKNNAEVQLQVSPDNYGKPFQLQMQNSQSLIQNITVHPVAGINKISLNSPGITLGINTITLFSSNNTPVAERLLFYNSKAINFPAAALNKNNYATREKAALNFNEPFYSSLTKNTNFSVSVYTLEGVSEELYNKEITIDKYVYLTEALKGPVEEVQFYFSGNDSAIIAADNLMLTQGWRSFVNPGNSFVGDEKQLTEYEGSLIKGVVKQKKTALPVKNALLYIAAIGSVNAFAITRTDDNGNFTAVLKQTSLPGGSLVFRMPETQEKEEFTIELEDPFDPKSARQLLSSKNPVTIPYADAILNRSVELQAQNIYYRDSMNVAPDNRGNSIAQFYGVPTNAYYLDDYTRFNTMEEVIREYVAGVGFRKRKGKYRFLLQDANNKVTFKKSALVLFDGVPTENTNEIMAYNPLKIQKIEVLNKRLIQNDQVFPGVISFNSYKRNMADFVPDAKAVIINQPGTVTYRKFYQPKYDIPQLSSSPMPDYRTQLCWQQVVKPDGSGKLNLSFFTSDVKGKYKIVLQGIYNNQPVSMEHFFEVR